VIQNYFKELFKKSIIVKNKDEITIEHKGSGKQIYILTKEQQNDFLHFDGNAQGLRVVTKLQILNDAYGLNLTFATLGSYTKYPNYSEIDELKIAKHKIGVFQSEVEYFNKISNECGLVVNSEHVRHPLCFLMEAADSICYLTMDIEDGFAKKLLTLNDYYEKLKDIATVRDKLKEIYEDKENKYKNEITKLVNFRIHLIQQLVFLTIDNFTKNISDIENGVYNKELIFDDEANGLAQTLKDFCGDTIFKFREINSLEVTGHSVIKGLLDYYISFLFHEDKKYRKRASSLISESVLKIAFEENGLPENSKVDSLSDYYKFRVIVDFISGMTDQYALNHYQKISGQKIN